MVAVGDNQYGQCNVAAWQNIIDIRATEDVTFGMDAQGQIFACGNLSREESDILFR